MATNSTTKIKDSVVETMSQFTDYWDASKGTGLSVREFLSLVDAMTPDGEPTNEHFQLVKASYAPVNDDEIEKLVANTQSMIKRDLLQNFPSDEDFANMTKKLGIKILEGSSMILRPKFVTLAEGVVPKFMTKKALVKWLSDQQEQEEEPGYMPVADVFPDFDSYWKKADKNSRHIMRFKPKYRITSIDDYLIRALNPDMYKRMKYPKNFIKMALVAVSWLRRKVLAVGAVEVLANGDAESQLRRYQRNLSIRAGLVGRDISDDPLAPLMLPAMIKPDLADRMYEKLNELFPMFAMNKLDGKQVFVEGEGLLDAAARRELYDGHKILSFNKHSNAGLMFPENTDDIKNLKIGNVMFQDILMADMLLQHLRIPGDTYKSVFAVAKTAQMKSKWESIGAVKNVERVRNIFNANTFAQLPMSVICRNTTMLNMVQQWEVAREFFLEERDDRKRADLLKKVTARHLLGFTPFKGGLNLLMEYCMYWIRYVGSTLLFTYADNLYGFCRIKGKWHWFSVDGRGFECQSTAETATSFATRLSEANDLTGEWHKYCTEFWVWASIDVVGVLGKEQFPFPGLGSGTAATAYENTERMLYLVAYVSLMYSDANGGVKVLADEKTFTNEFVECMKSVKLDLEITQVTAWDFTTRTGKFALDLLGYDCIRVIIGGVVHYVPYLTEDRSIRAVSFNKSTAVSTGFTSDQLMLMRLLKYQLLYYIGGWVVDELSLALTMLCRYTISRLTEGFDRSIIEEVKAEIEDATEVQLPSAEELGEDLTAAVPSPYDCMRFAVGEEAADMWTKDLSERNIDLILEAAGFSQDDLVTEEGEVRPPSVIADVLVESSVPLRSAKDDFSKVELKEFDAVAGAPSALRVTAARDHVLRGAMGSLEKYQRMDQDAREVATNELNTRAGWPTDLVPKELASLSSNADRKTRLYDVSAIISAATGSNIYVVVDYLKARNFDPTSYELPTVAMANFNKLKYIAKIMERNGGDATRQKVRLFIEEHLEAMRRVVKTREMDWALMTELAEIDGDPALFELNRQLRKYFTRKQREELYEPMVPDDEEESDPEDNGPLPPLPIELVEPSVPKKKTKPVPPKTKGRRRPVELLFKV